MTRRPLRLRRSVLYVPASNEKAVAKSETLACDAVIYDLEDAVAPAAKEEARERLRDHFKANPESRLERVIRMNALSSEFGPEDFLAARACKPDAILIPKVDVPGDVAVVGYDDISLASSYGQSLTTISQEIPVGGRLLVDVLFSRINGEAVGPAIIQGKLKIRNSSSRHP